MPADSAPLGDLVVRAGEALSRFHRRTAAAHGLSATALGVLEVLGRGGGLSHRELAGALGITPATLTPVVDELERAGEVRRERDRDDRRVVRLSITPEGVRHGGAASARVRETMEATVPEPGAVERDVVRRYLLGVLDAVAEDGVPAGPARPPDPAQQTEPRGRRR